MARICLCVLGLLMLNSLALTQCYDPPAPSVVICTPSPGSTVVYIPDVAVRFTPVSGAKIKQVIIYDNGRVMSKTNGDPGDIYDADVTDGPHHLVVKAWDTASNFFEAQEEFHVVGQGYPFCKVPDKPGVNFCEPPKNAFLGLQFPLGAAARGDSRIKNLSFYLDGVLQQSDPNTPAVAFFVSVPKQGVPYTAKVVATDAGGHQFTASKTVEAQYTYGEYACFNGCVPGINIISPQDEAYVSDSFALNMQIEDNPNPITSMTAYLDSTEVASSSGPSLQQQVTGAPAGTHILTVTGVDSQGLVYWIQENVNIDISK
jgi:hypothetical protein